MQLSYEGRAGKVELAGLDPFHNTHFGYTLFEEVIDPENPEGPKAIAMHVPERALSKVWQLVEPNYTERIELLCGSASLVVSRSGTEDWTTMPLSAENPTANDIEIGCGDIFCIVTDDEEAVVLSRPSKPFDKSYETSLTKSPDDELSQFILRHVAASETDQQTSLMEGYSDYPEFETYVNRERLVHLDAESFKRTTFEYQNPGGIGAFLVLSNADLTPTVFVDKELFQQPGSDGEPYEDILPLVLEHEIRELFANIQDRIGIPVEERAGGVENVNDEQAAVASMKSALAAGKLDKYLEFLEKIQYLATAQEVEYWAAQGYQVIPNSPTPFIEHNRMLAEQVKRENS